MKMDAPMRNSAQRIRVKISPTSTIMAVNFRSKSSTASSEDFSQSPRNSTSSSDKAKVFSYSHGYCIEQYTDSLATHTFDLPSGGGSVSR